VAAQTAKADCFHAVTGLLKSHIQQLNANLSLNDQEEHQATIINVTVKAWVAALAALCNMLQNAHRITQRPAEQTTTNHHCRATACWQMQKTEQICDRHNINHLTAMSILDL